MNSNNAKRSVARAVTVAGLALGTAAALCCGMVGCTNTEASSTLEANDATNASGTTVGAYFTPSSLTADNDAYEVWSASDDEVQEIYTFTLEGKEFTLPCAASEFASAGWAPASGSLEIAATMYSSPEIIDGGFILNGDSSKVIKLQIVNEQDASASWDACTVVGITIDGDDVDFETSFGIKVGDSFETVQETYGASSFEVDRFGSLGYHYAVLSDSSLDGNRWYGQSIDTLVFTSKSANALYPDWTDENYVYHIYMENFGDIEATE